MTKNANELRRAMIDLEYLLFAGGYEDNVRNRVPHPHLLMFPDIDGTYENSLAYAAGELPPNYPVPALPCVVDITPEYVAVFVWEGNEMTGRTVKAPIYVDCEGRTKDEW